jgi:hypothetical protein
VERNLNTLFSMWSAPGVETIAWCTSLWSALQVDVSTHSLSLRLNHRVTESPWFLDELQAARAAHIGLWILCGDFNLIYKVEDKNNSRLNYPLMRAFCSFLDELELAELHLQGRLDAWSNEQAHPTLSRIDHVFECSHWLKFYPHHALRATSSMCSDHASLLLHTNTLTHLMQRFKFEAIWPRFHGFLDVVADGWCCTLLNADACRILDYKLQNNTKSLKR